MDKYNDISNESFVKYFLIDLHSRIELTHYIYPHEFLEDTDAIEEHVERCKKILAHFIEISVLNSAVKKLNVSERTSLVDAKLNQLYPLVEPHISKYAQDVVVNYVHLYSNEK